MDRSLIKNTIIERLFFNEIINVEDYWPLFELSLKQENKGVLKNKDKPIDATLNQRNLCLEKLKNEKEGIFLFLILALNGAPHQRDSFNYNFNKYEILNDEFLKIIKLYKISRKISDDIKESIFVKLYKYQALSDSLLNSIRIKEQEIREAQEFEKEYNLDKEFDDKYEI